MAVATMISEEGDAHFARIVSAPEAPGAEESTGRCPKPGHGNFEMTMYCVDCATKFCSKCSGLHSGHATMPVSEAPLVGRSTSVPSKHPPVDEQRAEFDDRIAHFRRTTSQSSMAAARAIAMVAAMKRTVSHAVQKSDATLESANRFPHTFLTKIRSTFPAVPYASLWWQCLT